MHHDDNYLRAFLQQTNCCQNLNWNWSKLLFVWHSFCLCLCLLVSTKRRESGTGGIGLLCDDLTYIWTLSLWLSFTYWWIQIPFVIYSSPATSECFCCFQMITIFYQDDKIRNSFIAHGYVHVFHFMLSRSLWLGEVKECAQGSLTVFFQSFEMGENVDEKHGFQINQFPSDEQ